MQAVLHYGEAVKAVMNEELGDGIMSAIDMFADFKVIEGAQVIYAMFNRVLHDAAAEEF